MKTKSKTLILVLCVAALVAASIMGTLAYLTDRETAVNTFTVGKVSISLDEAKVNPDGTVADGAERVTENEYHLIPGQSYVKDPTVTVKAESEASYIRMMVTIHNASAVNEITGNDPGSLLSGWDSTNWTLTGDPITDTDANTVTYEYRYYQIVDAFESDEDIVLPPLFTTMTVPGTVTGEQLQELYDGGFKITVQGHAIQSATFADADEAWEAFQTQNGE